MMHLFLIRHGETEHNIAGLLAGVSDSRLTNFGALQAQRLGANLVNERGLQFTNVFASDLQRASMTANEICRAQNSIKTSLPKIEVVEATELREQDFGSLELQPWRSKRVQDAFNPSGTGPNDEDFKPKETIDAMLTRSNSFIDDYIVPLLALDLEQPNRVAVVSHGLFLGHFWRTLLSRFDSEQIVINPNMASAIEGQPLELMSWSNTGCLEITIEPLSLDTTRAADTSSGDHLNGDINLSFVDARMTIVQVNDKRHLLNLTRAGGGIGSAPYDPRQRNLSSFFKQVDAESVVNP